MTQSVTPFRRVREAPLQRSRSKSVLYPLDVAYQQAGAPALRAEVIEASAIPAPYHSLLVHERDMTLTLERHCGCRVVLRVLSVFRRGASYFRRVLLSEQHGGRPVEMGAIRINLNAFPPRVRTEILKNTIPLGRVLRDGGVDYLSRPQVFLAVTPNSEMMGVFWMPESIVLYGRRTEVFVGGRKIGDIVEILPPA
jgi:hypothetical protein